MSSESNFQNAEIGKTAALEYILEAWIDAQHDGIAPEAIANAALYAALSDLVTIYGEEPVIRFTDGLAERVRLGEFTIDRVTQ